VEEDNRASTGLVEKFGFTRDRRIRWFSLPPSLNTVDRILSDAYGHQNWWPAETPFEMMVGAILTQNTAWTNVEKALSNFETTIDARYLLDLPVEALEKRIRPSGLYRQKALRLKRLAAWYLERGNDLDQLKALDGEKLRNELLAIKGIGPETADSILLYALEKPFFVVDAYTRRLLTRLGYEFPKGYEGLRRKIEAQFTSVRPDEVGAYGDFHALIIRLAKLHCKATPICAGCPLRSVCRTGEEN
jgi:endonuclease-3 related protein